MGMVQNPDGTITVTVDPSAVDLPPGYVNPGSGGQQPYTVTQNLFGQMTVNPVSNPSSPSSTFVNPLDLQADADALGQSIMNDVMRLTASPSVLASQQLETGPIPVSPPSAGNWFTQNPGTTLLLGVGAAFLLFGRRR